jgi:aminotransferase
LVQLRRVGDFIQRRREIARTYDDAFGALPWIQLPPPLPDESVQYFYWIQTSAAARDELAYYLRERGVYTTFRYWPLHRTALYADEGTYPGADLASETTLLIPIHQNLSDSDVGHVVDSVIAFNRR